MYYTNIHYRYIKCMNRNRCIHGAYMGHLILSKYSCLAKIKGPDLLQSLKLAALNNLSYGQIHFVFPVRESLIIPAWLVC